MSIRDEIQGLYEVARDTKFHLTGGSLVQLRDIALKLAEQVEALKANAESYANAAARLSDQVEALQANQTVLTLGIAERDEVLAALREKVEALTKERDEARRCKDCQCECHREDA